jgi:prepilin-type N-terminal cleavage/methylation domain-containing protein
MKKRGFTLMELLIVIAIIGILVSVSVVSYSSAQKKSRDSRRIGDMKAIQNAWEQYYADNTANYPSDASCSFSQTPVPGKMSGTYLPGGLPVDPKGGTPYPQMNAGWRSCSAASYCFCAGMENANAGNQATDCAGGAPPSDYNGLYCVKNLQ